MIAVMSVNLTNRIVQCNLDSYAANTLIVNAFGSFSANDATRMGAAQNNPTCT